VRRKRKASFRPTLLRISRACGVFADGFDDWGVWVDVEVVGVLGLCV